MPRLNAPAVATHVAKSLHDLGSVELAGMRVIGQIGTFVHLPSRCTGFQLTHRRPPRIADGISSAEKAVEIMLKPFAFSSCSISPLYGRMHRGRKSQARLKVHCRTDRRGIYTHDMA